MNNTPNKLSAVIISAIVMIVLSTVPVISLINVLCCMGIILGGFAGVSYYSRQVTPGSGLLTAKDSVMIGLLSGIIAGIVNTGISLVISLFSKTNPIAEMLELFSNSGSKMPPEAMEILEKLSQEFTKYGYSPTLTIITLVMNLVLFPLFGILGSYIAFHIFKKKNFQQPPIQQ
ncbi:MAG: hypothetical protein JSS63_02715 [Bacteroidetes bacterium]|nr:hypothetical protein [Bacteroidota bacterium]MBX7045460.1 hypothetical protein [Ignavibacteria bacterium]